MAREWFQVVKYGKPRPWDLDDPVDASIADDWLFWELTSGKRLDEFRYKDMRAQMFRASPRKRFDWLFCTHGTPVVDKRVFPMIRSHCGNDVQRIPLRLYDDESECDEYEIFVITNIIPCFDYTRDTYELATGSTRELRMISPDWSVDRSKIPGNINWLYVEEWPAALIVSGDVVDSLRKAKVSGVSFLKR